MIESLKALKKKLDEYALEIPKLSMDVSLKRRELLGPLKSFEPSPAARMMTIKQK